MREVFDHHCGLLVRLQGGEPAHENIDLGKKGGEKAAKGHEAKLSHLSYLTNLRHLSHIHMLHRSISLPP